MRMIEWGQKSKPKKIPRWKINPKKYLAEFLSGNKFGYTLFTELLCTWLGKVGTTTNLQFGLKAPQKSLLKSSHPTKIQATFSCPLKNPESKISTLCCLKLASNNSIIFGHVEKCFTGIVINRYTLSPPPLCTLFDFEFDCQMWPQILYKEALNPGGGTP